MRKIKHITLSFILTIILAQTGVHPVLAQSVISAIPPRLVLSGIPGEIVTAQLKVRNDSEVAQNYTIAVEDFVVYDTQGTPIPIKTSANNRWSLASWITAPDIIPIDAKTTQIVNIKVRVPMTALPGGHYAMLTYMPNADVKPGQLKKTASIIGQRVGTLIYFTVAGPVTEKLNILKFSVPQFSEQGPVSFSGTMESLSDIHITPKGNLTISDPLNSIIASVPIETGSIFPETQRDFTSTWDQKWGWGKYRADLYLAYGTTGAVTSATIFFWLFPIRLVIYSLIAIISVLVTIILLNKRSKRHQEFLEKEVTELKEELEKFEQPKM